MIEKKTPSPRPRGAGTTRSQRKRDGAVSTPAVTVESVAARLLSIPLPDGTQPVLWRKTDFARLLTRSEKGLLDAALARLQDERRLVALDHGGSVFFAWAEALRTALGSSAIPALEAPVVVGDLPDVYRRLVRESGGFPDVKISALARALGTETGGGLSERLIALWRTGDATLSLGDWSLVNEETRAAAVELDGEKYLLVRFEQG